MKKVLVLAASVLLLAGSALAEGAKPSLTGSSDDQAINSMDHNRDGMISRDEFMKHQEQMFNAADKGGKGMLNRDEARTLLSMEKTGMIGADARARMREDQMGRETQGQPSQLNQPSQQRGTYGSQSRDQPSTSNQPGTRGGMPSDSMRDRDMQESD